MAKSREERETVVGQCGTEIKRSRATALWAYTGFFKFTSATES